ncbi:MAG: PAS domain S-box protein [Candidatus Binatia bacterium]
MADSARTITSPTHRVPLRVLLVEDSEADAELLLAELRRGGYQPTWERVDTASALTAALGHEQWDVITCDWVMPQFSGRAALALLRERQVDLPIIIASGQVGEEYAVTAMKAGAHDFISKRNLARLCPAVERELKETEERRAHKRAEEMVRRSEEKFRVIFNNTNDAVFVLDLDGQFLEVNQVTCDHLQYTREELLKLTVRDISTAESAARVGERIRKILRDGHAVFEAAHIRRDGTVVPVEVSARPIEYEGKPAILSVDREITERKRAEETLRKSEERYRSLFENMQEGLAYCRMLFVDGRPQDFIYLTVNDAFETLTGLKNVEGRRVSEVIPGIRESDPQLLEIYGRVALTGKPERFEIYVEALGMWFAISVYCPEREHFVAVFDVVTERKRAEGALRLQSEIARNIAEGVYLVGAEDLRIVYANPKMEEMFGYAPGEMTGKHVSMINAPTGGDPVQTARQIEKALTETGTWRGEVLNMKKDGTPFWGQASISMLRHPEYGDVYVSLQMDISERKRAEAELRAASRYARSLIEASLDPLVTVSPEGKITDVNQATATVTGHAREQLIGTDFATYFTEPERARAGYELAFRAGTVRDYPLEIHHGDGHVTSVLYNASVYRDDDGQVVGIFAAARDVTERRQAEAHEKLALAALQLLDRPGNVRFLAGQLLRLIRSVLDVDAAAIRLRKGEDFPYLAHDGFPEAFVRAENSLLVRGCDGAIARDAGGQAALACACGLVISGRTDPSQPVFTKGGTFWRNDSSVLLEVAPEADPRLHPRNRCIHSGYMSIALVPLRHGEQIMGLLQLNDQEVGRFTPELIHFLEGLGASIGIALSGRQAEEEISRLNADLERRVAERTVQLEVSNKELEAFGYSVSHDLRAPLRAVDGFSTMLLDRYGAQFDAQGRHYLQRVRAGAQRMNELINDLLVLSRITRSEMSRQSVDLSTLGRTIVADLRKTQPDRQVEFVIADDVVVEGDAGLLRAALENLLGNAWKYTSKHPTARIEFGVSQQDGQPIYFVRDDGAGFDMAYVDRLFGAFQRLHATDDFEGTGIGLATVQRIIRRHGGRVWAEGAVEHGATFSFTLPEATVYHESSDAFPPTSGSGQLGLF